ncbi:hypothetical protein D1007_02559 [Hordeum vulgare]|nr:hypothetical protein D1007_02559 [Hordeum vulgare]
MGSRSHRPSCARGQADPVNPVKHPDHLRLEPMCARPNLGYSPEAHPKVFAYLCDAFLGVMPSMAFLRKFFRLRLIEADECSGCVAFETATDTRMHIIDMWLPKKVDGFKEHWVYMDSCQYSPFSNPRGCQWRKAPCGGTLS